MTRNPARKTVAYRYIPGSLGTGCTLDNGAVVTQEFRLTKSRDKRLAELLADPRVQWARAGGDTSRSTSSYGF